MKKILAILMLTGLLVASLGGAAAAGKKAKPSTFFLHGRGPVAEAYLYETWLDDLYMEMNTDEPTAAEPSSIFVTNYMRGPNTDCDGNGLLPVWKGDFVGKHKGNVTVSLHTVATPATELVVSLYADATGTCSTDGTPGVSEPVEAPKPVAQETVAVTPGPGLTEVTFKNVKFKAVSNALLQLHIPTLSTPGQIRVLFDSTEFPSSVTFNAK